MSDQLPVGWGFHPTSKSEFDQACAEVRAETDRMQREHQSRQRDKQQQERMEIRARREQLAIERKAAKAAHQMASFRAQRRGAIRRQHLNFALWMRRTIAISGEWPTPFQVHERFDISVAHASAWLRDFEEAIKQEWL